MYVIIIIFRLSVIWDLLCLFPFYLFINSGEGDDYTEFIFNKLMRIVYISQLSKIPE